MRLVIDYLLEGENRGYNFVTPTDYLHPDVVKAVWRNAMPRGQGWSAPSYIGARSLKCIPLGAERFAISEVTVTERRDEMGRQGLRRAEITVMNPGEHADDLERRWNELPASARAAAENRFGQRWWRRAMPQMNAPRQIVLAYPYTNAEDWLLVEAYVLKLATAQRVRGAKAFGSVTPFTTLALDYREESQIVAIPLDKAQHITPPKGVSVINLHL